MAKSMSLRAEKYWTDRKIWVTTDLPIVVPEKERSWDILLNPENYHEKIKNELEYS